MLKLKEVSVKTLPLVVVGCTRCGPVSQCVKPPRLRRDNAAFDWQTLLNGITSPQREADHYAKTTGRKPEVY